MQALNDDFVILSRIIDIGAIIVAITSVVVTTRQTVKTLAEKVTCLTSELHKNLEVLGHAVNRHDTELARIRERCNLLTDRGEGCKDR